MTDMFETTTDLDSRAHLLMRVGARRYLDSRGLPSSPVLEDREIINTLRLAHGLDPVRKDVWDITPGSETAPERLHGHLANVLDAVGVELAAPVTPLAIASAFEDLTQL